MDRPAGASSDGRMGLVNHFLDIEIDLFGAVILIPDTIKADSTNSVSSITAQVQRCVDAHGRMPNYVLVGFRLSSRIAKTRQDPSRPVPAC